MKETTCEYPIVFSALTAGTLQVAKANATVKLGNLNMNISKVVNKSFLNMTFDFDNGIVELGQIDLNYIGNKTFVINATHSVTTTIGESKESHLLQVFYSKFNRTLPYTFTSAIVPYGIRTVNSTNVTPFKQTDNVPILNITGFAKRDWDIGLRINQTFNCLQVKALNSSNTSLLGTFGLNLTNTTQTFSTNNTGTGHQNIWMFFDLYACDPNVARRLILKVEENSCCTNCSRCWG